MTSAVMGSGSWSLSATLPHRSLVPGLPYMGEPSRFVIPSITYTLTLDGERYDLDSAAYCALVCVARMALMTWTWGRRNLGNLL